ncbi:colicin E3/pyocin S6 family cytotoxin [Mycobacteroides abscessus]
MSGTGQYIARTPPDFLSEQYELAWSGESRWRNSAGDRIYTYDRRHGHIEAYTKRGRHVGVLDVRTGEKVSDAKKGRKIDV